MASHADHVNYAAYGASADDAHAYGKPSSPTAQKPQPQ